MPGEWCPLSGGARASEDCTTHAIPVTVIEPDCPSIAAPGSPSGGGGGGPSGGGGGSSCTNCPTNTQPLDPTNDDDNPGSSEPAEPTIDIGLYPNEGNPDDESDDQLNLPDHGFLPDDYPGMYDGYPYEWWEDDDWIRNNMLIASPDGQDEVPNPEEVKLFAAYPAEAVLHVENSNTALEEAQDLADNEYGNDTQAIAASLVNGKYDAFRHAYWNALGTAEFDKVIMILFATAHEYGQGNGLDVQMDLFNNHVGRDISENNNLDFFTSDSTISAAVLAAMQSGLLVKISGGVNTISTLVPTP